MKTSVILLFYWNLCTLTAIAQEKPDPIREDKDFKILTESREDRKSARDVPEYLALLTDRKLEKNISEAQRLTDERKWSSALEVLTSAKRGCDKADTECSTRVDYSMGYLYQKWFQSEKNKEHEQLAISAYQRAIEADPNYAACYFNLALIYRSNGDLRQAIGICAVPRNVMSATILIC